VECGGYMFIHCIWVYSRQHQRKGWGSVMIEACLEDAKTAGMSGAAVMVRDGPWLADRRLFLANGFEAVDTAPPDYQLLVRKLDRGANNPAFKNGWDQRLRQYSRGLTIIRSSQCPHIAKFAADIAETAEKEYHIKPKVVDLESCQRCPECANPLRDFRADLQRPVGGRSPDQPHPLPQHHAEVRHIAASSKGSEHPESRCIYSVLKGLVDN
jgi:hypothetical protein